MGSRILTIIEINIYVCIFLLIIAVIVTDTQTSAMKDSTRDFVETIRYKGYITQEMYEDYLRSLSFTTVKIELVHSIAGEFSNNNVLDLRFTKDIIDEIYTNGLYKLNEGDDIRIILQKASPTYFQAITSIFTGKQPIGYTLITVNGGMVLNEQYN